MRPAGSPGTCGALYRAKPTGVTGIPEKPPDAPTGLTEGRTALPAQRTGPTVTDGAFPSAAASATQEEAVSETTEDVDATTEVAGL